VRSAVVCGGLRCSAVVCGFQAYHGKTRKTQNSTLLVQITFGELLEHLSSVNYVDANAL